MTAYYTYYLDQLKNAAGAEMGQRGLQYMLNDSWEAGQANWTDEMIAEFTRRRGYDMKPWLPVLVGHVVESSEASDRFLWDFRIGDQQPGTQKITSTQSYRADSPLLPSGLLGPVKLVSVARQNSCFGSAGVKLQ